MITMTLRRPHQVLLLAFAAVFQSMAADGPETQAAATGQQEIIQLKSQLADQQRQIEELRLALQEQRKLIQASQSSAPAAVAAPAPSPGIRRLGEVASTTPVLPPATPPPALAPVAGSAAQSDNVASPLQIHIGDATITPVGFMDFTSFYRSTATGSGIGTNFGSVPFNLGTAANGKLTEFRNTAQNSRLGLRVDANVHGAQVMGYMEGDFLGFVPVNAAVTSNSDTFRLRLYWLDVRKGAVEVFGGQSWSMLTPNRNGLSALPGDLFYSQDVDTNYQLGLTWSRNAQFRFIVHPSDIIAAGVSFEAPEQYIGGSGGAGTVTLPSALAAAYANQLNNGNTTLNVPNVMPDIIAKVAFDPKSSNGLHQHFEIAGLFRSFRTYDPISGAYSDSHGYGGSVNVNFELFKGFHLVSNNFVSDGGGRWIFGQAPDLIIRADGSISPIHSGSTVDGFEIQAKNTLLYAYWGGVYIRKNYVVDPAAAKLAYVGYGYPGSGNSNNRIVQEPTFGLTQTFWRDPKWGAIQLMLQYSYVTRSPWALAAGSPSNAHANIIYANLRYQLPGSAPTMGK
jgi:hypothetical protein